MTSLNPPTLEDLQKLREELESPELDQGKLFAGWPADPASYSEEQLTLLRDMYTFQRFYNGGVQEYIRNGKHLLSKSSDQLEYSAISNPPYIVEAPSLYEVSEELQKLESAGAEKLKRTIFVLVAGGLGERLGFHGIKLSLPVETATHQSYMEHYLSWIRVNAGVNAPFIIMTSDDTHQGTTELLSTLGKYDTKSVRLLKQEMVFCFSDNAAHIALGPDGHPVRKPHGHGDVHSLLYAEQVDPSGKRLVDQLLEDGYEYIVFFQDTNGSATYTLPITLAISEQEKLDMNFTCIPRQPTEAIGLVCQVKQSISGDVLTVPIEYNEFERLAKALTPNGGDVAAHGSIYSPFPGTINTLLFRYSTYVSLLKESQGTVPEFINPKYVDSTKTAFKSPARIESLMQDFALLFDTPEHRVGGTVFDRQTYQPVKNSLTEAIGKAKAGISTHCAASGEEAAYETQRMRIAAIGVDIPCPSLADRGVSAQDVVINEWIGATLFPIVSLNATARGVTLEDLKKVFPKPEAVHISARSALVVEGNVVIESLVLDGALHLTGPSPTANATSSAAATEENSPLVVRDLNVTNEGWKVRRIIPGDEKEVDCIRGFILVKSDTAHVDKSSAKL